MRIVEVIEAKRWKHLASGQTASIYGAVPWCSDLEKGFWTQESVGWTWLYETGIIGMGRKPVASRSEAIELMRKVNRAADEQAIEWSRALKHANKGLGL